MHKAPDIVGDLVKRFDDHIAAYKSGSYNETQLRREFLDPFFEALGWDVHNKKGYAEPYKEVIHEDSISVGAATKAPDYCFRVGGTRKFFVEAKKPSVNLKDDISPAFQLKRYAWSSKLPLSILTDFEEFAIYECTTRPQKTDKASKGRILYLKYDEYPDRWDELYSIFSRDAILKGSFDKYAASKKLKRGTAEVDDEFLKEIERWRELLARNIALRNSKLSQRELNYAVQQTIDRIVFLRICEDRGIEDYGRLMAHLNGANIYRRMMKLFREADDKYNSGLFHFTKEKGRTSHPDELTPSLVIDDKILKDILKRLYYPESPYEFSVIPANILGQVYERFLGKVIRLTKGHHAKIEDKPEVRKAGGVYYTPAYIVDYIVKNTVGELLKDKTPREASKLRMLDPACGSGSFLIGAYQHLLDWHRNWYSGNNPEKWAKGKSPAICQTGSEDWQLTTAEKKRILLNNIYGVDIDPQAVEVTKLSLLLKILEGESSQTLKAQLKMFQERALPDLSSNIKCGNSLIGPDFYEGKDRSLFDEEEQYRINVFDWQSEFKAIMKGGGFDAVIGNPPYVFTREQLSANERNYFSTNFRLTWEKHNTFMLFMEQMLKLIAKSGRGSFIVPNSWLTIESGKLIREVFVERLKLISDLNYAAFNKVSMEPCIFVILGKINMTKVLVNRSDSKETFLNSQLLAFNRDKWVAPNYRIVFTRNIQTLNVMDKIVNSSISIGEVFDVRTGLQAYEKGKGKPPQSANDVKNHVFDRDRYVDKHSVRYLQGKDVGRYCLKWAGMWMQYGPWLAQPRNFEIFKRPRVLVREITSKVPYCLNSTFVNDDYLNNKSILNILHNSDNKHELKKLIAILNSRLMSFFYKNNAVKSARKIFPKVVIKNLREFPYPVVSKKIIDKNIIQLVDHQIDLQAKLNSAMLDHEKKMLKRQIEHTDRQIDSLVYELYGLTDEEIRIIEEEAS